MERRMSGSIWAAVGLALCILGALLPLGGGRGFFVFFGILALIYGGYCWAWRTPEHEDEAGDIHFDENAYPLP